MKLIELDAANYMATSVFRPDDEWRDLSSVTTEESTKNSTIMPHSMIIDDMWKCWLCVATETVFFECFLRLVLLSSCETVERFAWTLVALMRVLGISRTGFDKLRILVPKNTLGQITVACLKRNKRVEAVSLEDNMVANRVVWGLMYFFFCDSRGKWYPQIKIVGRNESILDYWPLGLPS